MTYFQDPDVSVVTNPTSALCLLKALLSEDKLGHLVPSEIAKVISILNTSLNHLSSISNISSILCCLLIICLFLFHRKSVNKSRRALQLETYSRNYITFMTTCYIFFSSFLLCFRRYNGHINLWNIISVLYIGIYNGIFTVQKGHQKVSSFT